VYEEGTGKEKRLARVSGTETRGGGESCHGLAKGEPWGTTIGGGRGRHAERWGRWPPIIVDPRARGAGSVSCEDPGSWDAGSLGPGDPKARDHGPVRVTCIFLFYIGAWGSHSLEDLLLK
jgi:hypothetical protein